MVVEVAVVLYVRLKFVDEDAKISKILFVKGSPEEPWRGCTRCQCGKSKLASWCTEDAVLSSQLEELL